MARVDDGLPVADHRLLDLVVPAGHGTVVIWATPQTRRNPPRMAPPPLVHDRERLQVAHALAVGAVGRDRIGTVSGADAAAAAEGLMESLNRMIDERVATLSPVGLLELVMPHERAAHQANGEAIAAPARAALETLRRSWGRRRRRACATWLCDR